MKKFYTLALAALVCGSASAFDRADVKSLKGLSAVSPMTETVKVSTNSDLRHNAPVKVAPAEEELIGDYKWSFYSYLNSSSGQKLGSATISKVEGSDELNVSLLGWDVKATYDATTGVLSFPSEQFIEYNEYNKINVYFYHNRWNDDGEGNNFLTTPLEATFDGSTITFDDYDNIAIGNVDKGWFIFAGSNEMTKKVQLDMENGWSVVGTGSFYDGWVLSGMGMALEDVEDGYGVDNVTVERNEDGLYRLNNPYQVPGCVFMEFGLNVSTTPGYIVFDISDPEFVTVYPGIYSGITDVDQQGEETDYYNSNMEAYYTIVNGNSKEVVVENAAEIGIENFSNFDMNTGTVMFYNCCFGVQGDEEAPYTWVDKQQNSLVMTGKFVSEALIGAGVSNVVVDDSNAPVEYFNLQGIRVANPENGLYIRRQGNTATKVLVK